MFRSIIRWYFENTTSLEIMQFDTLNLYVHICELLLCLKYNLRCDVAELQLYFSAIITFTLVCGDSIHYINIRLRLRSILITTKVAYFLFSL